MKRDKNYIKNGEKQSCSSVTGGKKEKEISLYG